MRARQQLQSRRTTSLVPREEFSPNVHVRNMQTRSAICARFCMHDSRTPSILPSLRRPPASSIRLTSTSSVGLWSSDSGTASGQSSCNCMHVQTMPFPGTVWNDVACLTTTEPITARESPRLAQYRSTPCMKHMQAVVPDDGMWYCDIFSHQSMCLFKKGARETWCCNTTVQQLRRADSAISPGSFKLTASLPTSPRYPPHSRRPSSVSKAQSVAAHAFANATVKSPLVKAGSAKNVLGM